MNHYLSQLHSQLSQSGNDQNFPQLVTEQVPTHPYH